MKRKVYIESTVVSYYSGQPTRDLIICARQEETRALWPRLLEEFDSFISALVVTECRDGNAERAAKRVETITPFPILDTSEAAEALANALLEKGAVPDSYPEDALHIAIAAV